MRNRKINRNFLIMILVLCITLGYAYLNSELKINGTTGITGNSWNVHFENVVPSSRNTATVNVAPVAEPQDKVTDLTYDITFNRPGDVYEFNVDIVNAGSIDGMIESFVSKIKVGDGTEQVVSTSTLPSYLNYYVTYDDGVRVMENHLLEANNSETITVHVEYKMDITKDELTASAGKTFQFRILSGYVQANDNAKTRLIGLNCTFDGEMVQGAEYVNGQYTYRYKQQHSMGSTPWSNISIDGWGVALTDPTSTDPVTTRLCTIINKKPIVSMAYMFYNSQASEIDASSFETSNVTSMLGMFYNATEIESIDLSNFDTSSLISMPTMFSGTTKLENANLDNWDLRKTGYASSSGSFFYDSNIKNLSARNWKLPANFSGWISRSWSSRTIETIDVTGWDLSLTTDINGIFGSSGTLKTITGLDTWDTSNITNMNYIFQGSTQITSIDLSKWNTRNVTTMTDMFNGASNLTELNLDNWNFTNVTSVEYLLKEIGTSLETISARNWVVKYNFSKALATIDYAGSIDVSGWNLTNTSNLSSLFRTSRIKKYIGLDTWDVSHVSDMSYMFYFASSNLDEFELKITNWNVSNVGSFTSMFYSFGHDTSKGSFTLKNFIIDSSDSASDFVRYVGSSTNDLEFTLDNVSFGYSDAKYILESIGAGTNKFKAIINNLSLPNVTSLECLFWNIGSDSKDMDLTVTNLNAPRLTDTYNAFLYTGDGVDNVKIELKDWQTPNLVNTSYMFMYLARASDNVDLTINGLNTSKVTNMSNMFKAMGTNTKNLKINLINFNTSKAENMESMFYLTGQYAQTWEINGLSNLDLSKVTNMKYFMYNISDGDYVRDIGTLDIYATDITDLFYNSNVDGTLNIHKNPTTYTQAFTNTSKASDSSLTVNYTSEVTDIDNIIATKSSNSNVIKGSLIS